MTPQPRSQQLAVHAEGLAWKLQGLDPEASVVAVVSLNLLDPLLEAMEHPKRSHCGRYRGAASKC